MIHYILTIFILMLVSCGVQATAQSPDKILVKGEKYSLNTNPLESYLKDINWDPPKEAAIWSSNWRGYLALWEIKEDHLVLLDMTIEKQRDSSEEKRERISIMETVFPEQKQVVASWYSGALIIPDGEMINYVHMGYGSTYENYQVINLKNGLVIDNLRMTHSEFLAYRSKKFKEFKKTVMFKKEFENLIGGEYDWSEEEALDFMQSFYAEYYLSQ